MTAIKRRLRPARDNARVRGEPAAPVTAAHAIAEANATAQADAGPFADGPTGPNRSPHLMRPTATGGLTPAPAATSVMAEHSAMAAPLPRGPHPSPRARPATGLRRAVAAAAILSLAACAGGQAPGTGSGLFGGLRNPFGGGIDPDLRGRLGGSLDTSSRGRAATPGGGAVVDPFAGQGVSNPQIPPSGRPTAAAAAPATGSPATVPPGAPAAAPAAGAAAASAARHTVAAGETAWSIARRYGVSVADLARANALPETMTVRTGQTLVIPASRGTATTTTAAVTAPGAGSPTPQPPSASKPLPREETAPARAPVARPASPDLGATRTAASGGGGRFQMPVAGSIVRTYSKGRNEGIDISAPQGTAVKAAGGGTVAAITRDTDGVPIVVVRHEGSLMTVYSGLGALDVAKGDKVGSGDTIGTSGRAGVLHFEVRQGFESVDPETYLR